jgi:hypothetical protein
MNGLVSNYSLIHLLSFLQSQNDMLINQGLTEIETRFSSPTILQELFEILQANHDIFINQ